MNAQITPPTDSELEEFWARAKPHADLNLLPTYLGTNPLEVIRPNAWSFGSTAGEADRLLDLVVTGKKTATSSDSRWYDDETPAPAVGEMSIIVNSHGRPKALVVTTQVATVPFDEVDAEHAQLEGEGDLSLAQWRESHEGYFSETPPPGVSFSPMMPVLLQQFAVLYKES